MHTLGKRLITGHGVRKMNRRVKMYFFFTLLLACNRIVFSTVRKGILIRIPITVINTAGLFDFLEFATHDSNQDKVVTEDYRMNISSSHPFPKFIPGSNCASGYSSAYWR